MWYVIGFIFIALIAIWLIAIVAVALPVFALLLIILFFTFFIHLRIKLKGLDAPRAMVQFIDPQIQQDCIEWHLVDKKIKDAAEPLLSIILSVILAMFACWLAVAWVMQPGHLIKISFSGKTIVPALWEIYTAAALITIGGIWLIKPRHVIEKAMKRRIHKFTSTLDSQIHGCQELKEIESEISSISTDWGIDFPHDHMKLVRDYLSNNAVTLTEGLEPLNQLLRATLLSAKEDVVPLRIAYDDHANARALYGSTAAEVTKTGSICLIKEMETLGNRLFSSELVQFLTFRKWDTYQSELAQIVSGLVRLHEIARKYQDSDLNWSSISEETAYAVLGIPASSTAEQIKTVYRRLATIYHPDSGIMKDDTKMKQINLAFESLRDSRGFA